MRTPIAMKGLKAIFINKASDVLELHEHERLDDLADSKTVE